MMDSVFERSGFPVRVKKTRQKKKLAPGADPISAVEAPK
jgi:hypothetical protein